ncbi:MAG: hypothetical protein HUU16_17095 [Candidatus Omnitrophica bacterium]|nr:hypothetical protein [Candidatus Omnitrophota bacterium]
METNILIGVILILVGLSDAVLGVLIVGPRVPEQNRKMVTGALLGGAVACIALGFAFIGGLL